VLPSRRSPSFAIGFVAVAAWAIVIRVPLPSLETLQQVPAYGYFGGLIVTSYVISITFLAAQLGVGNAIRLVVTGQIVAAVIIDHVGAFGAVVQRLTMGRAIGVVLMIVGVVLARPKAAYSRKFMFPRRRSAPPHDEVAEGMSVDGCWMCVSTREENQFPWCLIKAAVQESAVHAA
jgi:bacterial/archaeal transporter family-2 protein